MSTIIIRIIIGITENDKNFWGIEETINRYFVVRNHGNHKRIKI